jgi:hypothetical protein
MSPHDIISRRVGLALVITITLARSVVPLVWGDVHFNSDHATTGLMAKHIAEGRAFPVMQYGTQYVLVLEAWLAAPLMFISDHSPAVLAIVPVSLNVVMAALLYFLLTRGEAPMPPGRAVLATLPVALPSVAAGDELTEPLGMNVEPLLFSLALWLLRDRPIALGIVAAIGVKNREFVLYAIAALLLIDVVRHRSSSAWRPRAISVLAFGVAWGVIGVLAELSTPFGPGTSTAGHGAGDNMAQAAANVCIAPEQMPHDITTVATRLLPFQYGLRTDDWGTAGYPGPAPPNLRVLWWPFVAMLVLAVGRGGWRAWRYGASEASWLGAFLVIVGMEAVAAYALTQCGRVGFGNLRYVLQSIFIATGAVVLVLERERHRGVLAVASALLVAWVGWNAYAHATLLRTFISSPPERGYAELARYLDDHHIRYIVADYWIGYHVAFLTSERVQPWTYFNRIREHARAVDAHLDESAEVRVVSAGPCEGAVRVGGFYVCKR